MPAANPPADPTAQLQWLVDRAAIGDLLVDFARALDEQDWEGYAANYAPEGTLGFNGRIAHSGREGLVAFVSRGLGRYAGTHHISANHAIRIDGDHATTRSYLIAAHLLDAADPSRHADGAGWYDCEVRRTDDGWRFVSVMLTVKYVSGEPIAH
jgi:uncharacterized protein (TIGR02246 family)